MGKTDVRKRILAGRDALSLSERQAKSAAIWVRLKALPEYAGASTVLFYVDFRSEVMTLRMIDEALKEGKRVIVPKVDRAAHRLVLFEIKDPADLVSGYMGIPEPSEGTAVKVGPAEIDLVVMPGVGFDTQGKRLGYGGGYYDRLIETLRPNAGLVALAFEVQVEDEIPSEPHDKRVSKVITETREIEA